MTLSIWEAMKITSRADRKGGPQALKFSSLKLFHPYIVAERKRLGAGFLCLIALSTLAIPSPLLMKYLIDEVIPQRNLQRLGVVLLALILVQLARMSFSLLNSYLFTIINQDISTSIKRDLFHKILRLPFSFYDNRQTGYIASRIGETSGLNVLLSDSLIRVLIGLIEFVISLIILFQLHWKLTLISLTVLPLFYLAGRISSSGLRATSMEMIEKSAHLSKATQESLSGVEVIKMFTAEDREVQKIYAHLKDLKGSNIRNSLLSTLSSEVLSLVGAVGGFIVLWFSGAQIIRGTFTLGAYVAFSGYLAKLYGPTLNLSMMGISLQPGIVAVNRITELFSIAGEDEDKRRTTVIPAINSSIELQNVDFAYTDTDVIKNVSFLLEKGDKVLLKGPNGSGKTTLLKLLMGLYPPMNGRILIDGRDINTITLASLRDRISVVSQNAFLFNGSILQNVLYGNPSASKEDIAEAMSLSDVTSFYHEAIEIGEMGKKLSGGEKQKISIARAILKDADVIILDEATSNMDEDSVRRIGSLLKTKFKNKFCLIVSHREWDEPEINKILSISGGGIRICIPK